jgi:hypothetical protein
MELNISEFDDVEDVGLFDDNTFIPHVKPILKPILKTQPINPSKKKQVTYDDILSSLNMTVVDGKLQIVRNNVLEKGKANIVSVNASNVNSKINSTANINYNQIHQKFQQQQQHQPQRQQTHSNNVSRIQSLQTPYERQQQQYQLEQEVPEPLTREQYKQMVMIQYLNNEAQKRRINEMKSKKMMFSTISNNNINISSQRGNSADLNRLFPRKM